MAGMLSLLGAEAPAVRRTPGSLCLGRFFLVLKRCLFEVVGSVASNVLLARFDL